MRKDGGGDENKFFLENYALCLTKHNGGLVCGTESIWSRD